MKKIILPALASAVLFTACSGINKTAQTPDDVYYSPGKAVPAAGNYYTDNDEGNDDNYLRMKVRSRYRWNAIDDYSYWNDSRYDFGFSCTPSRSVLMYQYNPYLYGSLGWGSPFGYYYTPWGTWYNPAYTVVYYKNPKAFYGNTNKSLLTAYNNKSYNNNNRQGFGSLFKGMFNNSNASNNYGTTNTRTFNSGTTPSSSAGGRSGGFNSSGSTSSTPRKPR